MVQQCWVTYARRDQKKGKKELLSEASCITNWGTLEKVWLLASALVGSQIGWLYANCLPPFGDIDVVWNFVDRTN